MLALWSLCVALQSPEPPVVELQRVPEGEVQPQALVDADGVVHLLTLAPDVGAGELRWRNSDDGGHVWTAPLAVGEGVASDATRRGGRIALGRAGRPHVAWPGSARARPRGAGGADPLLYTRLDEEGRAFERARNVVTGRAAPDAACAIAADGSGNVWVLWSAPGAPDAGDVGRSLWIARSQDDGATFAPERALLDEPVGVCAASAPAIESDGDALYVLYRVAGERDEHGTRLLVSRDGGASFAGRSLDTWTSKLCSADAAALRPGPLGMLGAWSRAGALTITSFRGLETVAEQKKQRHVVRGGGGWWTRYPRAEFSHPVLVVPAWGEALVVTLADAQWGRDLRIDWSVYAEDGTWLGSPAEPIESVPETSLATAFARDDGTYVVIY